MRGIVCVLTSAIESAVTDGKIKGQHIPGPKSDKFHARATRLTRSPRPQPIDLQRHRRRVHADISDRPALPYQFLTHVERRWDSDGFHHDVEAVDLGVEVRAGCCAECSDVFAGGAGVNCVSVWAREHTLRKLEARVREVEESYAARGVEG